MGTVPAPARPLAGVVLAQASTDTWYNAQQFLLQPPSCQATVTSTQTAGSGVPLVVAFGSEDYDVVQAGDTEMHSTSTNPERITIRTAGRYHIHGFTRLSAPATSTVDLEILKNGALLKYVGSTTIIGGYVYCLGFSFEGYCAVGDYLSLRLTLAGSTLTVVAPTLMTATWRSN